jgi:hypothetical protein
MAVIIPHIKMWKVWKYFSIRKICNEKEGKLLLTLAL